MPTEGAYRCQPSGARPSGHGSGVHTEQGRNLGGREQGLDSYLLTVHLLLTSLPRPGWAWLVAIQPVAPR